MPQVYEIGTFVTLNQKGLLAGGIKNKKFKVIDYDGTYYRLAGLGLFLLDELCPVYEYDVSEWTID